MHMEFQQNDMRNILGIYKRYSNFQWFFYKNIDKVAYEVGYRLKWVEQEIAKLHFDRV